MKQKIKKLLSLFLVAVMLLSLVVPAMATEQEQTAAQTPDLRVGILSDVHLGYAPDKEIQTVRFKKALEAFEAMGVDAVIVAGDLQDAYGGSEAEIEQQKYYMEEFASTWFEVFPADSGVEPIFIYGNHDEKLVAKEYWSESLGSYTDAFLKEVNGYQFVGVQHGKEGVDAVDAYLSEANKASADKPVFYIQHYPIYQTVPGSFGNYSYSKDGFENLAKYPNAVAFNGHTHVPLTDERSIWQGENWQTPFTVVNTATINYSGLGQSGLGSAEMSAAVNETNGWKGLTQHGMYMTVTGSQVSIDRYSFTEESPVKLGESWSFDACDTNDRPYTYANRYEMAAAPVFGEGAMLTVGNITDTTATVVIPAATMPAVEGYSDMIHSYMVEATDPATGVVMARSVVATEHHIDNQSRFSPEYTVNISGLQPGKTYTLNAYALEFFQKRSAPLTVSITTTGTAQPGAQGDVNGDGLVNTDDLTLLQAICNRTAEDTQWSDVDGNRVKEKADITALENILANKKVVSEDPTVDAFGNSTYVSFTNYSGDAWNYGLQTTVTNGGSGVALKASCTEAANWPYGKVYFDEPLDWSAYSQMCFDSLFINENHNRWFAVSLISGYQYQLSSVVYPAAGNAWTTNTVNLSQFTNVDFSDIRGIQFSYNMENYEDRYDGVTEHGIYFDNLHAVLTELDAPDSDLLGTAARIEGGQRMQGAGQVAGNGSLEAVQATANTVNVTFAEAQDLSAIEGFAFCAKISGSLRVQAVAADGSLMGNAAVVTGNGKWQNVTVSLEALGLTGDDVVAGLCFTSDVSGYWLDNLYVEYRTDGDLSDASTWVNSSADSYNIGVQGKVTNNSSVATAITVISESPWDWPKFEAYFPADFDEQTRFLSFDVKRASAGGVLYVCALDADGNKLGNDLVATTPAEGEWTTYSIDLLEKGLTAEQISQIAAIRFAPYIDPAAAQIGDAMYVDNMQFKSKEVEAFTGDLLNGSTWANTSEDSYTIGAQSAVANCSEDAVAIEAIKDAPWAWPKFDVYFPTNFVGQTRYVSFDVNRTIASGTLYVCALDAAGNKLGEDLVATTPAAGEWTTFNIDLLAKGLTEEQISQVAAIRFAPSIQSSALAGEAMYVDNLQFLQDDDLISIITWKGSWAANYGKFIQSEVTNGSFEAVAWQVISTNPNAWPQLNAHLPAGFDEQTRYLTFDVKRASASGDLYVSALDASGKELVGAFVADYSAVKDEWTTYSIDLIEKGFTQEQISQIAIIRFAPNIKSGAQIGEAMYVDNMKFLPEEEEVFEGDLLVGSTWKNTSLDSYSINLQTEATNCSDDAVEMKVINDAPWEWPKFEAYFPATFNGQTRFLSFDVKPAAAGGDVYICVLDADGNKLGNDLVATTPTANEWTTYNIDLLEKGLTEEQISQIAAIRFAPHIYTANAQVGDAMYVDNMQFLRDDDLVSSVTWKGTWSANYGKLMQTEVTNGSFEAAALKVISANPNAWPQLNAHLPAGFGEQTRFLSFDVKRASAGGVLYVSVWDAAGNKLGNDLVAATPTADGWTTYSIDLLEKGLTEEQISQISVIRFAPYIDTATAQVGDAMYIDNLQFLPDDNA